MPLSRRPRSNCIETIAANVRHEAMHEIRLTRLQAPPFYQPI